MKLIKTKANFMIFLIISTTFYISLLPKTEAIQSLSQGCCEKTTNENYCQYTTQNNCAPNYHFNPDFISCNEASYCQPVCCIDSSGLCHPNTGAATCYNMENSRTYPNNPSCSNIPDCQLGCCKFDYTLTTQIECENRAGLNYFDSSITNEYDCIALGQQQDTGCCIENDICIYITRSQCSTLDFYRNTYCSTLPICNCQSQDHKGCIDTDNDVYWFDSCNNKESVAISCDESQYCGLNEETNDYECLSINCYNPYHNTLNPLSNVQERKHGESWCIYEGKTGPSLDLPGSRHYRHYCYLGKEYIEDCADLRSQYCVQGTITDAGQTFSFGKCLPEAEDNLDKATECITDCNTAINQNSRSEVNRAMQEDKQCCESKSYCFWTSSANECKEGFTLNNNKCTSPPTCPTNQYVCPQGITLTNNHMCESNQILFFPSCNGNYQCPAGCNLELTHETYNNQQIIRDAECICPTETSSKGRCIPLVPPGIKFWKSDSQNKDLCEIGNTECTVVYRKNKLTGSKTCKANCDCLRDEWVVGANQYCRSLGDCGAHYNVAGEFSSSGISENAKGNLNLNLIGTFEEFYQNAGMGLYMGDFNVNDFPPDFTIGWMVTIGLGGIVVGGVMIGMGTAIFGKIIGAIYGSISASLYGTTAAVASGTQIAAGAATVTGWIPVIGWIVTIISVIILVVGTFMYETETKTYHFYCEPWQPPYGANNCDKCIDQEKLEKFDYNTCTEYKCKSLGAACESIQITDEQPYGYDCIENNPNQAVIPPRITPNIALLEQQGYAIQQQDNGYTINSLIPAFQNPIIAILTDQYAECKYTTTSNYTSYNDMPSTYISRQPPWRMQHNITLTNIATNEQTTHTYYIRCINSHGAYNTAPYIVRFITEAYPDLQPPVIRYTQPLTDSYVATSISEYLISIFVDDRNTINCKWSQTQFLDYENMQNNFICNIERNELNLFECTTLLTNIQNNTINNYYFRCQDSLGNTNQQDYSYSLKGTSPLSLLLSTNPQAEDGKIFRNNITLKATTNNGAENGISICRFSQTNQPYSIMTTFLHTNSTQHTQSLLFDRGIYNYSVECRDIAGNSARDTIPFEISVITPDITPSQLYHIYTQSSNLYIILNEGSNCQLSTNPFTYGQGTQMSGQNILQHSAQIQIGQTYYILCQDLANNTMPQLTVYL